MVNHKKEEIIIIGIFLVLFIIPVVYANLWDTLKGGMDAITGRTSQALSATITVGNNAPNISDVSIAGQSWAPSNGGLTGIEISFLANDAEGVINLQNSSAKANVSYISLTGAGTLTDSNTTCTSNNVDADTTNYTCTMNMQYYWDHSTAWTVDTEISDANNNLALNSSNRASDGLNWTFSELIATNFSASSLGWASVVPLGTNQTSTTTETIENTGNSLSLLFTSTLIDLSEAGGTYIPAGNFTIFNETTNDLECDSLNQSAVASYGVNPIVGVNNTAIVILNNTIRRGAASSENIYHCLFDVPGDLTSATYNTDLGGSWDISSADSGE